jgi:hypothetical protein
LEGKITLFLQIAACKDADNHRCPIFFANVWSHRSTPEEIHETYDIQASTSPEGDEENIGFALWVFCDHVRRMEPYQFRRIQNKWFPTYDTMPLKVRLAIVRAPGPFQGYASANTFRHAVISDGLITAQILEQSVEKRMSILHTATCIYGAKYTSISEEEDRSWQDLLGHLIRISSDLHTLEPWQYLEAEMLAAGHGWDCDTLGSDASLVSWTATPFLTLIKAAVLESYSPVSHGFQASAQRAVRAWIQVLSSCDVDLKAYGDREKRIFSQDDVDVKEHITCRSAYEQMIPWTSRRSSGWHIDCHFWREGPMSHISYRPNCDNEEVPPVRLASFTYGPSPEDWTLIFESCEEEWAGVFLDTIEQGNDVKQQQQSQYAIPGGWISET